MPKRATSRRLRRNSPSYSERAKASKLVTEIEEKLHAALTSIGWRFVHGKNKGTVTDYDYKLEMKLESPDDGTLVVYLYPNIYRDMLR